MKEKEKIEKINEILNYSTSGVGIGTIKDYREIVILKLLNLITRCEVDALKNIRDKIKAQNSN